MLPKFCNPGGDLCVACPICGWDYVHIEHVEVIQNGDSVVIKKDGPHCKDGTPDLSVRGAIVKVMFFCENGDRFSHTYEFYKGHTSIKATDEGRSEQKDHLWRD